MSKVFQQKLGTKTNSCKAGDPLKINFLSLSSLPWLRPCLGHTHKKIKNIQYITKCDVKVMTHLNFGRNNGKPAAVTSWGLGDVGGKLRLGGGGNLSLGGGSWPPQHPPNDAHGNRRSSMMRSAVGSSYMLFQHFSPSHEFNDPTAHARLWPCEIMLMVPLKHMALSPNVQLPLVPRSILRPIITGSRIAISIVICLAPQATRLDQIEIRPSHGSKGNMKYCKVPTKDP